MVGGAGSCPAPPWQDYGGPQKDVSTGTGEGAPSPDTLSRDAICMIKMRQYINYSRQLHLLERRGQAKKQMYEEEEGDENFPRSAEPANCYPGYWKMFWKQDSQ